MLIQKRKAANNSSYKGIETEHEEALNRLRDLYDNAPCGYHSLDHNGIFIEINQTELDWMGYSREEVIGKMHIDTFLAPEFKGAFLQHQHLLISDEGVKDLELQLQRKDGSLFHVELSATAKRDDKGQLVMSRSVLTDVTEKKKAELNRKKTNEKFRILLESLHEGVLLIDTAGNYEYANPWLFDMLGQSPVLADQVPEGTDSCFLQKLLHQVHPILKDIREERHSEIINLERTDGSVLPVRMEWTSIRDGSGEAMGYMGTFVDMTVYTIYEEELRSREEHFRSLIESSSDLIMILDEEMKIRYISPSVSGVLGYTPSERVGRTAAENIHPEDLSFVKKTIELTAAAPGETHTEIYRCRHKDGSWKHMEAKGKALFSKEEDCLLFIINARDISEQTKAEVQLQYKVKELNTFMYKASHDLRAPLSSLLGLIGITKQVRNQEELPAYFEMIEESTRKMDNILLDLVSITKISQGVPDVKEIILQDLVEEVVASLENSPEFRKIEFITDFQLRRPFYSDLNLIRSLIQNLLDNSAKYQSDREGNYVKLEATETPYSLVLKISDNGIGIPVAFHKKVYDMFYRATTTSNGTGLGLYIVKNAIEKLGGTIELESKEGEGTTFFIELPNACPIQ